ncbi:DEAD/DEAH box helicase [Paraflavitalea speifideaquila]|uniref:DEAD/DEAH box helicase n=1 Tax=Paraflavitalea speifideaquila TaxID=3076558 RepID=UPI0028ED8E14|nr:DEAD/DEAH box helicase [Paraflavitalea speifideiaquila]
MKRLEEGKIDIIIGTHGILGKEVKFKDLGLLVIDEEQKFGVAHKEKIKTLRTNVDCLTLTATPIPRTLQFSLMGARDLSIINTPPPTGNPFKRKSWSLMKTRFGMPFILKQSGADRCSSSTIA